MATTFVEPSVCEKAFGHLGSHVTDCDRDTAAKVPNRRHAQIEAQEFLPTILVATDTAESYPLVLSLKRDGYLLLQASCEAEALYVIMSHSRLIRLLLVDATRGGEKLARMLKPYRREMAVFFVTEELQQSRCDAVDTKTALAQIREMLPPPPQTIADTYGADTYGKEAPRLSQPHHCATPRFIRSAFPENEGADDKGT